MTIKNWWDQPDYGTGPLSFAPSAMPHSSSGSSNDPDQSTEKDSSPSGDSDTEIKGVRVSSSEADQSMPIDSEVR